MESKSGHMAEKELWKTSWQAESAVLNTSFEDILLQTVKQSQSTSKPRKRVNKNARVLTREELELSDDDGEEQENTENVDPMLVTNDVSDSSEDDNQNIVGKYVIVHYDGSYFPGMVNDQEEDDYEVSTMEPAGTWLNWRWLQCDDKCWYKSDDVKCLIDPPVPVNSRGVFKVPEILQYVACGSQQWLFEPFHNIYLYYLLAS